MGDRYQQWINGTTTTYQLDLAVGLTQVLSDGTDNYLYGLGRIAEYDTQWSYFHTDALGSVRQLTDAAGEVTFAQSYEPYGAVMTTYGTGGSNYAYTGELSDPSGLTYLRARYMNPFLGNFTTRDTWGGDYNSPMSLNRFIYVEGNPVNYTDPSGYCRDNSEYIECVSLAIELEALYGFKFYWPDRPGQSIKPNYAGYRPLYDLCDYGTRLLSHVDFTYWSVDDMKAVKEGLKTMEAGLESTSISVITLTQGGVLFRHTNTFRVENAIYCNNGICGTNKDASHELLNFSGQRYSIGFSNAWSGLTSKYLFPKGSPLGRDGDGGRFGHRKAFTVVHEYGHGLHYYVGLQAATDIYNFYYKKGFGAPSDYASKNPLEYFADAFTFYIYEKLGGKVSDNWRAGSTNLSSIIDTSGTSLYDYFEKNILSMSP